jgi:hypothetical protein
VAIEFRVGGAKRTNQLNDPCRESVRRFKRVHGGADGRSPGQTDDGIRLKEFLERLCPRRSKVFLQDIFFEASSCVTNAFFNPKASIIRFSRSGSEREFRWMRISTIPLARASFNIREIIERVTPTDLAISVWSFPST